MKKENYKSKLCFFIAFNITIISFWACLTNIQAGEKTSNKIEYYNVEAYDSYSSGNIYIGEEMIEIPVDSKDIFILDERGKSNPNMKICDSYKITDSEERKEILQVLLDYEKEFPSNWERSLDAMEYEWRIHNMFSKARILKYRTDDVDLDNNDENFYLKVFKLR